MLYQNQNFKNKLVSCVIPVYNVQDFLPKCLDSILKQTYNNIEIIIINDGSTDLSLEICNSYSNKYRNIHVYSTENRGVSAARNYGIRKSLGNYICFIDPDDYIDSTFIETLINTINQTKALVAGVGYIYEHENGKKIYKPKLKKDLYSNEYLYKLGVCKNKLGYVWSKIYNIELFSKHNLKFDEELKFGEDSIFLIELSKTIQFIGYNKKSLYHYVKHTNSLVHDYNLIDEKKLSNIINFLYKVMSINLKSKKYKKKQIKFLYHNSLSLLHKCNKSKLKNHYTKEIQKYLRKNFFKWIILFPNIADLVAFILYAF